MPDVKETTTLALPDMVNMRTRRASFVLTIWLLLSGPLLIVAGCSQGTSAPATTPTVAPAVQPSAPGAAAPTSLTLRYPIQGSEVVMGQGVKFILSAASAPAAQLLLDVRDAQGARVGTVTATLGDGGVYRTAAWTVPHRTQPGVWTVALAGAELPAEIGRFNVQPSVSETLLANYGFWLDVPSLRGITPALMGEKGDAHNGMIRLGGVIPSQHIFPEAWVEVHWRESAHDLGDAAAVRRFMLHDIGEFGVGYIRALGPFQEFRFKQWPGWRATARGQVSYIQMEWIVFAAPEVGKTFAIGTTVVLPPAGIDPHAVLRESFDLPAGTSASGVAPAPLPRLLPGPELIGPPLGARFEGLASPIVLRWAPVKPLAADEFYAVTVDFNYQEANPILLLATRSTTVTLPAELYSTPNCHIFNWQVALMREVKPNSTGVGRHVCRADATLPGGCPPGEALSFQSLYAYIEWVRPATESDPFPPLCPNAQD